MNFRQFLEARDLLGREIPSTPDVQTAARQVGAAKPFFDPRPVPAKLMRLDARNSRTASEMIYDPQKREAEVTYRDGSKRRFQGLDYEVAKRAETSGTIDNLIRDLEVMSPKGTRGIYRTSKP